MMTLVHSMLLLGAIACELSTAVQLQWHEPLERGVKISPQELADLGNRAEQDARAQVAAQRGNVSLAPECFSCAQKDYVAPCPSGWEVAIGRMCTAPAGYGGYCRAELSFDGESAATKR
ncbi:unnamed protein product, partial [Prorocentrum cordatum]